MPKTHSKVATASAKKGEGGDAERLAAVCRSQGKSTAKATFRLQVDYSCHYCHLGGSCTSQGLLRTGDIQSIADLGNNRGLVGDMRTVPFGLDDITRLAAVTAAPFLPLLLTSWSPEELIMRLVKVIF